MTIKPETAASQRTRGPLGTTWRIAVFLFVFAVGMQIDAWSSTHSAYARKMSAGFCQITDANQIAKRVGLQGPRAGIHLLTNHRKVGTGEVVNARLVNFSDSIVLSGAEYKIQRYKETGWQTDPSSPDGPWPRSAKKLKPGKVSGCYRYVVPKGQPAGQYRFLTMISKGAREYPEVAQFSVRGRAG